MTTAYDIQDTIAAIASAPGGAARGIVRVSGPDAVACLERVFVPCGDQALDGIERTTALEGGVRLPGFSTPVNCRLYLWPGERSYTRQPLGELHTIGSPPVLEAVLRAALAAGARPASQGEFTLRAFLAGRLDLTQAEAVLGVIDAHDARQLEVALDQLAGGLWQPLRALRERLLDLLAHLEAGLDFADEDIEFIAADTLIAEIETARTTIAHLTEQMQSRSLAGERIEAALVGWPNVGKSSLFNALAGSAAALTSPRPGTTRDYLTARLELDGTDVTLVDTAGICDDELPEAVDRASLCVGSRERERAAIEILCLDTTRPLNAWERKQLAEPCTRRRVVVLTKTDAPRRTDYAGEAVATSSHRGAGLSELAARLRDLAIASQQNGDVLPATAQRCRESLRLAGECLERARSLAAGGNEELVAAELRVALYEIGKVVGAVYTDDVLDRVFSRFCIGK